MMGRNNMIIIMIIAQTLYLAYFLIVISGVGKLNPIQLCGTNVITGCKIVGGKPSPRFKRKLWFTIVQCLSFSLFFIITNVNISMKLCSINLRVTIFFKPSLPTTFKLLGLSILNNKIMCLIIQGLSLRVLVIRYISGK